MSTTVDEIQIAVAKKTDLSTSIDQTSDSYSFRLEYINQRERTWAEKGDWRALYREYYTNTSTSTGNASIVMPNDFRNFAGYPKFDSSEYTQIRPNEQSQYNTTDKVFWFLNDNSGNLLAVLNTGDLASGATIFIPYYRSAGSLASPSDVVLCPNPQYIIDGVTADVWESREDQRFIRKQEDADITLRNMLEFEFTPDEGSKDQSVRTVEETQYNYRWGRD